MQNTEINKFLFSCRSNFILAMVRQIVNNIVVGIVI